MSTNELETIDQEITGLFKDVTQVMSQMFWLKACSRCNGDLYTGRDIYGTYVCCLQCAHCLTDVEKNRLMLDIPTGSRLARGPAQRRQAG